MSNHGGPAAYLAVIYRDEAQIGMPDVEHRELGSFNSEVEAFAAIRGTAKALGWPRWSGKVREGHLEPRISGPGVTVWEFVDDEFADREHGRRWRVGPESADEEPPNVSRSTSERTHAEWEERRRSDYTYVRRDIRRIGVTSLALLALLLLSWIAIEVIGVGF